VLEEKQAENRKIRVLMLSMLTSKTIHEFDGILPPESKAWNRARLIEKGDDPELSTSMKILHTLSKAHKAIVLADNAKGFACGEESIIDDLVVEFSSILGGLFPVQSKKEKNDRGRFVVKSPSAFVYHRIFAQVTSYGRSR
jgi:hypothetical protein